MRTDIIIPTCKAREDVQAQVREIQATAAGEFRVLATCLPASAAVNRNYGLPWAQAPYVIMVDDDVTGFPLGWNEALAQVLVDKPECVMVSARLLRPDGRPGQMLGNAEDRIGEIVEVARRELPTACIAIRNDETRFDEGYIGSGWEDTDFCARLRGLYPHGTFLVHCGVRVIHRNEQKNQGVNFERNQHRYAGIWGKHRFYA